MVNRTFKICSSMYDEFKLKLADIRLVSGGRLTPSAAIRGLIWLFLNEKIPLDDIVCGVNETNKMQVER